MANEPRPVGELVTAWLALLLLTALSVSAAALQLGRLAVLTAIAVAVAKAGLVVQRFMNLKREERMFRVMLLLAVLTLGIILLLTFVDVLLRAREGA